MNDVNNTIKKLIKHFKIDCTVDMFKYYEYLDWYDISRYQSLSEPFIIKYQNKIRWYWISYFQSLSEDFITKFQNYVDWDWISFKQTLSENFITKFQNYVNWDFILNKYYNLSDQFIIMNEDYIMQSNYTKYTKKLQIVKNDIQSQYHNNLFNIELY